MIVRSITAIDMRRLSQVLSGDSSQAKASKPMIDNAEPKCSSNLRIKNRGEARNISTLSGSPGGAGGGLSGTPSVHIIKFLLMR